MGGQSLPMRTRFACSGIQVMILLDRDQAHWDEDQQRAIGAPGHCNDGRSEGRARSLCTVDSRGSWGSSPFEQHVGLGPPPASRRSRLVADEQYGARIQKRGHESIHRDQGIWTRLHQAEAANYRLGSPASRGLSKSP